jgi:hypothetical protein
LRPTPQNGNALRYRRKFQQINAEGGLSFTPSLAAAADLSFIADEQAFVIA